MRTYAPMLHFLGYVPLGSSNGIGDGSKKSLECQGIFNRMSVGLPNRDSAGYCPTAPGINWFVWLGAPPNGNGSGFIYPFKEQR